MAKSKAASKNKSTTSAVEKRSSNFIVEQYQGVRSELSRVTWPTREEARQLTIAVTGITVVIALFLALVDALFFEVVTGIVNLNIFWIIGVFILIALIGLAFYSNSREL